MDKEIVDPAMKEFFNIPEKFYEENAFLRNIKISYIRYENLSEKQRDAYLKTVQKMREEQVTKKEEEKKLAAEEKAGEEEAETRKPVKKTASKKDE